MNGWRYLFCVSGLAALSVAVSIVTGRAVSANIGRIGLLGYSLLLGYGFVTIGLALTYSYWGRQR